MIDTSKAKQFVTALKHLRNQIIYEKSPQKTASENCLNEGISLT
jgi:hypothetical protein